MDSYKRAKESIVSLLGDTDYKVISLIGKWGTGKTHLWKSVSADCAVAVLRPIYVSAFGTKSAAELKLRILQNAYLQDSRATQKVLSTLGGLAAGWFRKATGADVESAAIAWLPKLVENRSLQSMTLSENTGLLRSMSYLGSWMSIRKRTGLALSS